MPAAQRLPQPVRPLTLHQTNVNVPACVQLALNQTKDHAMSQQCVAEETTAVQVRLNDRELEAIENCRRSQRKIPSRSEVLRILLSRALQAEKASAA